MRHMITCLFHFFATLLFIERKLVKDLQTSTTHHDMFKVLRAASLPCVLSSAL